MPESKKNHASDLGKMILNGLDEIRDELREEVVSEVREEMQQEYDEQLQESLAQIGVVFRNGEIESIGSEGGGRFDLNDSFFAKEAQTFLQETWQPLIVQADSGGQVTTEAVRKGIEVFISGAPLPAGSVAGDTTSDLLLRVMDASEQRWKISPTMRSAVRAISTYTLGHGVTFQAANPEITEILREYWKLNSMPQRMMSAVQRRALFSEHFFQYRIAKNGQVFCFDKVKPYEIGKVLAHEDDNLRPLAYGRVTDRRLAAQTTDEDSIYQWYPDIFYFKQLDSPIGVRLTGKNGKLAGKAGDTWSLQNRMQMCRSNALGTIRGLTDAYTILRWDKYYEDFVTDRTILNHERSKVVWVRKVKGSRNIPGGRAQRGPKGGQVLTETDQIEWKTVAAEIHAGDVSEDGRLIRLMLSAGWGIPEHILHQDPSEQVYASIRAQDTPFSQLIAWGQTGWQLDLEQMFRFVLHEKVRLGVVPHQIPVEVFKSESRDRIASEVKPMMKQNAKESEIVESIRKLIKESETETMNVPTEDVKIRVDFPNVIQLDPLKKAQVSEVLKRANLASGTDLAAEHGRDYLESMNELSQERDTLMGMGLIDDKILPTEKDRSPEIGKNDTKSPTTRNEPAPGDTPDDRIPDGDAD